MRRRLSLLKLPFRHPLLIALPIYVGLLYVQDIGNVRLWLMEPYAFARSSAEEDNAPSSSEARHRKEMNGLNDTIAKLAMENEWYRQSLSQCSDIRLWLGETPQKPIPARIILRGDSSNFRHSVYINRGSNDGIEPGFPITIGRTLVGRVKACSPHTSLVVLITDPESVVPVSLLPVQGGSDLALDGSEHATRGTMRGNATRNPKVPYLNIENVDLASGVKPGMIVVTNDASGQYPAGLYVGRISGVKTRQTFLELDVEAPSDPGLFDIVLVIPHRRPSLDALARLLAGEGHLDPKGS